MTPVLHCNIQKGDRNHMSNSETIDRTVAGLKQNAASATDTYNRVSEKAVSSTSEFAAFAQGNMEAFTTAGQIFANEAQTLYREFVQTSQTAFSEGFSNLRAIATAKSAKEGLELQANFLRSASVWGVNETARLAHASIEMAEKVSAPLVARAQLAAEKASSFKV